MSSIIRYPSGIKSVHNPILFEFEADNPPPDNYQFIVDLYAESVSAETFIGRVKQPAVQYEGSSRYMVIMDYSGRLRSYVGQPLNTGYNAVKRLNTFSPSGQVKIYPVYAEEYGTTTITEYPYGSVTGTPFYIFDGALPYPDWVDIAHAPAGGAAPYEDYDVSEASANTKFLTYAPLYNGSIFGPKGRYISGGSLYLEHGQDFWLYAYESSTGTPFKYVEIKTYNSTGTLLTTAALTHFDSLQNYQITRIPAGFNLNTATGWDNSVYTTPSLPILTTGVAQVTYQLLKADLSPMSKLAYISWDTSCTGRGTDKYVLYFKNEWGNWESYPFTGTNRAMSRINRSFTRTNAGTFDDTAVAFEYSKEQRMVRQFATTYSDELVLKTDWLNEDTHLWLKGLLVSGDVYVEKNDSGTYLPVIITNDSWMDMQDEIDILWQLTLNVQFTYINKGQLK